MNKFYTASAVSFLASCAITITSFAGTWVQDASGYRYQNDDGSFKQSEWVQDTDNRWFYIGDTGYMLHDQWIDGTYYVGSDGAMLKDTTTPDFYKVDKDGKYIPEDKAIESMELTISRNGNDVSFIVAPGGGYSVESFSILPNDRIEMYLVAQKGYYFGIGKASQITLHGAKFEKATRVDSQRHMRMTVALQDRAQTEAERENRNFESDEWAKAHKAELDLLIAYIQANDDVNAVQEIRKMTSGITVARFKYIREDGVGLYGYNLTNNNNNPCNVYCGGLIESKRENVLCDREGAGKQYRINITNPSSNYDYLVFRGEWHNDSPNGPGNEYRHDKTGKDDLRISGNYVDWYEDGTMTRHYDEKDLTFTYTVTNRQPVTIEGEDIVATTHKNGEKYNLHLYNCVQTALTEYTGYQKGNGSAVRTN